MTTWVFTGDRDAEWSIRAIRPEDVHGLRDRVLIRPAQYTDLESMLACERASWENADQRASLEMMFARMTHVPEGTLVAVQGDRVWGIMCFVGRDFPWDDERYPDHYALGAQGTMANHNPFGDTLCAINIEAHPDAPEGIGTALAHAVLITAVLQGYRYTHGGSRMPGYRAVSDRMSAEHYAFSRDERGELIDDWLRFNERVKPRLYRVQPDFYIDPESCNYAGIFRWENTHMLFGSETWYNEKSGTHEVRLLWRVPCSSEWERLANIGMSWTKMLDIFGRSMIRVRQHDSIKIIAPSDAPCPPQYAIDLMRGYCYRADRRVSLDLEECVFADKLRL